MGSGFLHYKVFWDIREHFRAEGMQLFQLTAKAHQNMHSCLLCVALSPRKCWCFGHEDFMGKMRILAHRASHASYGTQVPLVGFSGCLMGPRCSCLMGPISIKSMSQRLSCGVSLKSMCLTCVLWNVSPGLTKDG